MIKSTESLSDVNFSAGASYAGVEAEMSNQNSSQSNSLSYTISVLGGSSNGVPLEANGANLDDLLNSLEGLINQRCTPQQAKPIKFEMKSLTDVQTTIVSTYSPVEGSENFCDVMFKVSLSNIEVLDFSEASGTDHKLELYGSFEVAGFEREGVKFTERTKQLASRSDFITIERGNNLGIEPNNQLGGRFEFTIPRRAIDNGFFRVKIKMKDYDRGGGFDEDDALTRGIIGIKPISQLQSGNRSLTFTSTGANRMRVRFTFNFTLL